MRRRSLPRLILLVSGSLVSAAAIACGLDVTGTAEPVVLDAGREAAPVDVDAEVEQRPCDASLCVTAIAAEHLHTCAAIYGERPRCWGANDHGELGIPDASADANALPMAGGVGEIELVAAGGFVGEMRPFTCATTKDRQLSCWGDDSLGQRATDAGSDEAAVRAVPAKIEGMGDVSSLAAGGAHVCTGHADGGVTCWGYGANGQLGHPLASGSTFDPVPAHVALPRAATAIATGGLHSCVVLDDKTVDCFGLNNLKQLGHADTASSAPTIVEGVAPAVQVVAGFAHACAVLEDGTMQCWGYNAVGQLGQGTASLSEGPGAVDLPAGRSAKAACAGYLHSCAILDDGTVACWGYNGRGQVGTGSVLPNGVADPANVLVPQIVEGVAEVRALACAGQHTCALHASGTVTCWGANERGQLGRGTTDAVAHPEPGAVAF